jgi:hypothetical protein
MVNNVFFPKPGKDGDANRTNRSTKPTQPAKNDRFRKLASDENNESEEETLVEEKEKRPPSLFDLSGSSSKKKLAPPLPNKMLSPDASSKKNSFLFNNNSPNSASNQNLVQKSKLAEGSFFVNEELEYSEEEIGETMEAHADEIIHTKLPAEESGAIEGQREMFITEKELDTHSVQEKDGDMDSENELLEGGANSTAAKNKPLLNRKPSENSLTGSHREKTEIISDTPENQQLKRQGKTFISKNKNQMDTSVAQLSKENSKVNPNFPSRNSTGKQTETDKKESTFQPIDSSLDEDKDNLSPMNLAKNVAALNKKDGLIEESKLADSDFNHQQAVLLQSKRIKQKDSEDENTSIQPNQSKEVPQNENDSRIDSKEKYMQDKTRESYHQISSSMGLNTDTSGAMPLQDSPSSANAETIRELADQIIQSIQIMTREDRTDTVVTLRYPPLLEGAQLTLSEFNHAKGEFNLTFGNLSPEAKLFLDRKLTEDSLTETLERKGIIVHTISTTTQNESVFSVEQPDQASREDQEQQKREQQQRQQQQEEQENEEE